MTYNDKWLLTDLKLQKDSDGHYYLSAKYRIETEHRVKECIFPKILLPTCHAPLILMSTNDNERQIDLGFGEMPCPVPPIEKVIEEKVEELTVEEIEKRIGHKIKIVNKVVHIKNQETCDKCYWRDHLAGGHCYECSKCTNKDPSRPRGSNCNCNHVIHGDPCPYFKEDK